MGSSDRRGASDPGGDQRLRQLDQRSGHTHNFRVMPAGLRRAVDFHDFSPAELPPEWLGNIPQTHRAIDDARGYAHVLRELHRQISP